MGKKKDKSDNTGSSSSKKSKKHKHKKSSRSKDEAGKIVNVEEVEDVFILVDDFDQAVSESDLKLTANDSNLLIDEKSSTTSDTQSSKQKGDKNSKPSSKKNNNKKKDGKGDDDTDSDEERWLDAIQSGKLEEVDDELKRMKNPRLMTARQRAMLEKRTDGPDEAFPVIPAEPLMSLPTGFKEKVMTEEMLAKKAIKSEKRRAQAQEKREEDKKKTVDRLLKKQDSKLTKFGRNKSTKKEIPVYSYTNNNDGIFISIPQGMEFDLSPKTKLEPPEIKLCGVTGCQQPKKYSCSKTGVPLCSLECYKINFKNSNRFS